MCVSLSFVSRLFCVLSGGYRPGLHLEAYCFFVSGFCVAWFFDSLLCVCVGLCCVVRSCLPGWLFACSFVCTCFLTCVFSFACECVCVCVSCFVFFICDEFLLYNHVFIRDELLLFNYLFWRASHVLDLFPCFAVVCVVVVLAILEVAVVVVFCFFVLLLLLLLVAVVVVVLVCVCVRFVISLCWSSPSICSPGCTPTHPSARTWRLAHLVSAL